MIKSKTKSKTKSKQTPDNKKTTPNSIHLIFDNILNANIDTQNKPIISRGYSKDTLFVEIIKEISTYARNPVEINKLFIDNKAQTHISDIYKTLSQLGLKNNDRIFYIRNKDANYFIQLKEKHLIYNVQQN